MTQPWHVTCVRKRVGADAPTAPIEGIGGIEAGQRWYLPEADVIGAIEMGERSFFIHQGLHTAAIVVGTAGGRKYLKTVADPAFPEILLRLPECV